MMRAPIALAMDTDDLDVVAAWTRAVSPSVTTIKIGLECYLRHGSAVVDVVREMAPGIGIFLDLKLHDIPNTVGGAAAAVRGLRPEFLTVHALGGMRMVAAAAASLPDTKIVAVTLLTSHSAQEVADLGIEGTIEERVLSLAEMSVRAGARAIVCSPQEVARLRAHLGPEVTLITPGVRPAGSAADDQQRVATPQQALAAGADLLVIGRPITGGFADGGEAAVAAAAASIAASVMRS